MKNLMVYDASDVDAAVGKCAFVFSALEMGKDEIKALEAAYAAKDIPVVSNASANRWTDDVPMLIQKLTPTMLKLFTDKKHITVGIKAL